LNSVFWVLAEGMPKSLLLRAAAQADRVRLRLEILVEKPGTFF
jgi:hypothetical protein